MSGKFGIGGLAITALLFFACGVESSGAGKDKEGGTTEDLVDSALLGAWVEVNLAYEGFAPDTLIITKDSLGGSGMGITGRQGVSFYANHGNIGQAWGSERNVFYEYEFRGDTLFTEFQIHPDSLDGIVGSKGGAVQSFLKLP